MLHDLANGIGDRGVEEHAADLETCEVYAHGLTGIQHGKTAPNLAILGQFNMLESKN